MKLTDNKRIAIVGGGPGGLTLARLLQMNGAKVTVYERDASRSVRVQGATLDLHEESGLKALEHAGLMVAFKANYRPGADKMCVVDKDANIRFDEEGSEAEGGLYFRPEIDRGPLRDILLDALKPGTIVWDSKFLSLEQGDTIKLLFENGTTVEADIVIAADGANSKIRPYITPIRPFYSGVTALESSVYEAANVVPEMNQLLDGGKIFAFGDSKSLIVSSKGDGSLVFYPAFKADEFWTRDCGLDFADKAQMLAWFKTDFAEWGTAWYQLFEHAQAFTPRPLYCMPLDQTWNAQPNLTMLGDAAHLMPPYAGEGVNMAMLDALELAECLLSEQFTDVKAAIAAYEQQMRQRASSVAKMTIEQTDILHSPAGLDHMLGMFHPEAQP